MLDASLGHLKLNVHDEEQVVIARLALGERALYIGDGDMKTVSYVLLGSGAFGWCWRAMLTGVGP